MEVIESCVSSFPIHRSPYIPVIFHAVYLYKKNITLPTPIHGGFLPRLSPTICVVICKNTYEEKNDQLMIMTANAQLCLGGELGKLKLNPPFFSLYSYDFNRAFFLVVETERLVGVKIKLLSFRSGVLPQTSEYTI